MIEAPPEKFKTRAAACKWLKAEGVQICPTTFNKACEKFKLMQPDKSVRLADLLAYIKSEHKVNLLTGQGVGQSMSDVEQSREKLAEDLRNIRLKNDKIERENRSADKRWILREKAYEREGALITQIMGEIRFQNNKVVPAVIGVCKGDAARTIEVTKLLEEAVFSSFRAIYEGGEIDVLFDHEEDDE